MQSLKTKSLIKLLRTSEIKNLKQLLDFLDVNTAALAVAISDVSFWHTILPKCLSEHAEDFIVSRGDLETGDDWFVFCQDLVRGNAYSYSYITSVEDHSHSLVPTFSINGENDVDGNVPLKIEGTLPNPGRPSVTVNIRIENNPHFGKSILIVHQTIDECFLNAVKWMFAKMSQIPSDGHFVLFNPNPVDEIVDLTIDEKSHAYILNHIMESRKLFDENTSTCIAFSCRVYINNRITKQEMRVLHVEFSPIMPFPEY
jgi:hypothetical protein